MERNGYFQLFNLEDGTYIKIFHQTGKGLPVVFDEIIRYLSQLGKFEFDMIELRQKINNSEEDFLYKIDDEKKPPVDESFSVSLSIDGMQGLCKFYPPSNDGKLMDADAIKADLDKHGIKFGIDMNAIKQFTEERIYLKEYVVAVGKLAVQGKDGKVEYNFNREQKIKPKLLEDGTVDFRDLDIINRVKAGDVLARIENEVMGECGYTVLGKEIQPRPVTKVKVSYGKNIKMSDDGTQLLSEINGHVVLIENKLFVSNVMEFKNIDMSTGNINYDGNVIVKGDIRGGFTVTSSGNIDVYGIVEGAALKAEGNIVLRCGIQGGGKGKLEAKGNIVAKFLENSTVIAGGDIQSEALIHCNVSVRGEINLIGKKGLIVGGIVRAAKKITAKTVGTPMGVDTIIEVGTDPETIDRFHELSKEIAKVKKEIMQIVPAISTFQAKRAEGERIKPEVIYKLQELTKVYRGKKEIYDTLQLEYAAIEGSLNNCDNGTVIVNEIVYPGVKIMISDAGLNIRDERKYCKFCKCDAEVKMFPL